jgi:N-acetylneuraminic acid mutarotase
VHRWLLASIALAACGRSGFELATDARRSPGADDGAVVADDVADAAPGTSADAATLVLAATFTNLSPANPPAARRSSGAAVGNDNRIWTFGGFSGAPRNDLAAYTPGTNSWATVAATSVPGARERHVLAWHPGSNRLVLFGGSSTMIVNTTFYDELYTLDPATSAWTAIAKVGSWPAARRDAVMVWMPATSQLLLYGGNNGTGSNNRFSDLWTLALSGVTASWTQLSPSGAAPPARSAACVAFDPVERRLIVYGGETQDGTDVNTTYQYLVQTNTWQQDATTGPTPAGESFSQCAWDPVIGRVVLYGGQDSGGAPLGGAYAYAPDAKRWDQIALASGSPSPGNRSDSAGVYSTALGGMYWFGGRTATTTYTSESWLVAVRP